MSKTELIKLDKLLVLLQGHLDKRYVLHPGDYAVIAVRKVIDTEIEKACTKKAARGEAKV